VNRLPTFPHLFGLALLLAACGGGSDAPAVAADPLAACNGLSTASLAFFPDSTTAIDSAKVNAAVAATATAAAQPEHCEITGTINKRVSTVDGQPYAIKFHMRLPIAAWNGRFLQTGGGGSNGSLGSALGDLPLNTGDTGLSRGFAVITTDAGHDNVVNNRPDVGGTGSFGMDPQARRDHFYNSYDKVAQAGKALIRYVYGKAPDKSYFAGCSEGGREAFLMSQRFPEHFDGIVAGAPQIHQPKQSMASAAGTQALARYAVANGLIDPVGNPAIHKIFTDDDLKLVAGAINNACDALDGLSDGMVNNIKACTDALVVPKLDALVCTGGKNATCLTSGQVDLVKTLKHSARNASGQALYSEYAWDPGIAHPTSGYRSWWLGSYNSTTSNSVRLRLSTPLLLMVWETPPQPFTAAEAVPRYLAYDTSGKDPDPAKNFPAKGIYTETAGIEMINDKTDLSAFKNRGGKLLVWTGGADSTNALFDTVNWYDAMSAAMGTQTQDFARLFIAPGVGHCGGGAGSDKFDLLTPVVDWVEKGIPPSSIPAAMTDPAWFGTTARSRPLCAYPKFALYNGTGDINDAASFTCR
jgi:feruloyl esterase